MNKGCRPDPKTMPVTREYAEGHARTFGTTERKTGRWRWNPDARRLEEVSADWAPSTDAGNVIVCDRHYWGKKATDGADIGSRRKHKEYMKATGSVEASNYGPNWKERKRAEKDRARFKSIHETVERNHYRTFKP